MVKGMGAGVRLPGFMAWGRGRGAKMQISATHLHRFRFNYLWIWPEHFFLKLPYESNVVKKALGEILDSSIGH